MIKIEKVASSDLKSNICNTILRALPNWFGNEDAIIDYTNKVKPMPFYAVYEDEKVIGFVAIKIHNEYTAEVCVMGILEDYQRQGLGRRLIGLCEEFCFSNNKKFLIVKTLDESSNYEPYERTRNFYKRMGFLPLEVFPLFWDKDNPCLFLAKYINRNIEDNTPVEA